MNEIKDLIKKVKEAKNKKPWKSISVQAMGRALRSEWTAGMANDISSLSGIDTISLIEKQLIKELGNDRDTI
jgi:hypothetical protein